MASTPIDHSPTDSDGFATIHQPYLLVIPIPCYVDRDGEVWLERSWHHDLTEHLTYLKDFILCAPRRQRGSEPDLVRLEVPLGTRVRHVHLPPQTSFPSAFLHLPRTVLALWRAIGTAKIVHSAITGWPFPLGWIANPLALLRRKRLIIIVESDWRFGGPGRERWKHRLQDMDVLRSFMALWSCNRADLAIFTQPTYRDALRTRDRGRAYVAPAVWVNDRDILEDRVAEALWVDRMQHPVRILFAGRLVLSKGVDMLLSALRILDSRGVDVRVDFIGQGELKQACLNTATGCRTVRISVLDPVPYGKPFFELLAGVHAMVVPSLSQEQPRIIFDANSQAVPVIASDTDGIRPHVVHNTTGWLFPLGDVDALAAAIARASVSAPELRSMGLAALKASREFTHKGMHRRRSHLIREHCT